MIYRVMSHINTWLISSFAILVTNSVFYNVKCATASLVEAFKTAMEGMRIEMGEDGFASFVVDTITNEIYQ